MNDNVVKNILTKKKLLESFDTFKIKIKKPFKSFITTILFLKKEVKIIKYFALRHNFKVILEDTKQECVPLRLQQNKPTQ